MGTTASVVKIWEGSQGEKKAVIGNVGDSRFYIRHTNGSLEQVTLDDNTIREMLAKQTISLTEARALQNKLSNATDLSTLTPQEKSLFENRNSISQALGHNASPRIHVVDVRVGDKLIITSDGIHDNLTDTEISKIVAQSPDNQKAVENLIEAAKRRSRDTKHLRFKPDDMSAVIAEILPTGHKAEPPKPLAQPQLKETGRLVEGDMVSVQRSSGVIEDGWIIEGFNPKTGDAITRKIEGKQTLEKEIPVTELKALNPPKQELGIGGSTDFTQLFKAVDSMGKIQGSQQAFESAQLKQLINGVRSGKEPVGSITRAGGLRDKVAELLAVDRIKATLKAS
jgi:serine/threonine protein phosphatase PrpC